MNMIENLLESEKSEIVEMALSDHISFKSIRELYGLREKDVKKTNARESKRRIIQSLEKESQSFLK
jgi:soluble P-type ATPase